MSGSRTLNRGTHFQISCIGFLFVVGVILIIYFPTLSFEFTNWDDPSYVQGIKAIRTPGWLGIKEVLTKPLPASHGDYIPVTIFSYWMDYQVWGFQPKGYHLTNLLLHALSAGLLFLLLQRLTANPGVSTMATLLFALHPMNTEAVTWIAERKSVMALFWMLLSFHAFLSYQRTVKIKKGYYCLALLCYLLSCLSKTAVVFFPLLLLAYQVCLVKMSFYRSLGSVISFFVISVATAAGRLLGHYTSGQMVWEPFATYWVQGVTIIEIFGGYFKKLMMPTGLNNSYPLKTCSSLLEPGVLFGILVMVGIIILIVQCRRRYPLVSFGLLWYLAAWLPHAQIIAIPPALRADRYVYYSSPGLFLALVFFADQWVRTTTHLFNTKKLRFAMGVSCCVIVSLLASMTILRNNVWSNSISLWCDSVKKDNQNLLAHTNLGKAYEAEGMLNEAILEYKYVLAMNTTSAVAHYNIGSVYAKQGRLDEAITAYKRSLVLDPHYLEAHTDLGNVYFKKGELHEAIYEHKKSLELDPDYEKGYLNLGVAYGGEGRLDEAIVAFKRACSINPYCADAHNNLSVAYYFKGDYALAVKHYAHAQKLGFGDNQKLLELLKPYL